MTFAVCWTLNSKNHSLFVDMVNQKDFEYVKRGQENGRGGGHYALSHKGLYFQTIIMILPPPPPPPSPSILVPWRYPNAGYYESEPKYYNIKMHWASKCSANPSLSVLTISYIGVLLFNQLMINFKFL